MKNRIALCLLALMAMAGCEEAAKSSPKTGTPAAISTTELENKEPQEDLTPPSHPTHKEGVWRSIVASVLKGVGIASAVGLVSIGVGGSIYCPLVVKAWNRRDKAGRLMFLEQLNPIKRQCLSVASRLGQVDGLPEAWVEALGFDEAKQKWNFKNRYPLSVTLLSRIALSKKNKEALAIRINAPDATGNTPLHIAIRRNSIAAVDLLLKAPGININAVDQQRNTPLHIASSRGDDQIVTLLLNAPGIAINVVNNQNHTPLYEAAYAGHFEAMLSLLGAPGIDKTGLNNGDSSGNTPHSPSKLFRKYRYRQAFAGRSRSCG